MHVGVDVRWMLGKVRGMGRYATQLIAPVRASCTGLAPTGSEVKNMASVCKGNSFFPWWEQVVLPKLAKSHSFDFLICPYNTAPLIKPANTKLILVVHDLIFLRSFKELPLSVSVYQTLGRLYRRAIVPRVVKNADVLLTVSEFTKQELVERFKLDAHKVQVIPNAISDDWLRLAPLPTVLRKPYLFTVTGEAPSKNVIRLIEAFALAKQSFSDNYSLKIAGIKKEHHSQFIARAVSLRVANDVEFLGFISNEELQCLYREATGFIFASLFEGFGIPLIEAMAAGTPVCCSNTTSLPEVVGNAALLFDPKSVEEMAMSINTLLAYEEGERLENIQQGRLRVQSFVESSVNKQMTDFWRRLGVE
ncbi:glycosyltransferase family 1 protein [Motilimonas sp. 1_MG-2023]|uniref:glycosyltransferase family 4 protein n=1 Tax=Motilimonas sp. 1_MG-2023 TaxID=3062672 RepID=UPI0026E141FA|nr:glycosyltransferase family 1 protein [Motilimonas sp. 1_MG-2023]MDO6527442.1 glycosyltransferase family 1 protein [Motilimonas sp. 1_MG-2023]